MGVDTVRTWCEEAGITGTDLDTALDAWAGYPGGSEYLRIQSVIDARTQ